MAFSIGSITASLGIDTSGFEGGMLRAQSIIGAFGPQFGLLVTSPILAGVQAFGALARTVIATADELINSAESLGLLAAQTGTSVETIQALQRTLSLAGLSAEAAGDGLLFLSRQIGDATMNGKAAQEAFAALGLGLNDLRSGEQGVRNVVEALSKIEDEAVRNELAVRLLGRQAGPAFAAAMGEGAAGIEKMIAKLEQAGLLIRSSDLRQLNELDEAMDQLKISAEGLKVGLVKEFLAGFTGAGDAATNIQDMTSSLRDDLLPIAKSTGEAMAGLAGTIKDLIGGLKALDELLGGAKSKKEQGTRLPFLTSVADGIGDLLYGNPLGYTRSRRLDDFRRSRGRQP
jgi:biotin operon repressor